MIIYLFQHPGIALFIGVLLGGAEGILITVARRRLTSALHHYRKRKAQAQREEVILQALEGVAVVVEEDRLTCTDCWEAKHPGLVWPFYWTTRCPEHTQRYWSAAAGIVPSLSPSRYHVYALLAGQEKT